MAGDLRVPFRDAVATATLGVLGAISDQLEGRLCCDACGCLCFAWEACPGCRARRRR